MKNIIKQIKQGAKNVKLAVSEKAEIKSALVRYAKANPIKVEMSIPSPFSMYNFRNKKSISFLVITGLLLGGTVSFAAENTVPGDTLFPIKVNINENIRGTFAVTSKAKAELEVRLLERRLEEVEKLALMSEVTPEIYQVAEKNVLHYSERVKQRIEKFEEDDDSDDALETASKLSDVFNNHELVLVELNKGELLAENETVLIVVTNISTTTPVDVTATASRSEKTEDTLKKVRGARDEAKKKHKELKEKYDRVKIEQEKINEEMIESVTPVQTRAQSEKDGSHNRREEIRSGGRSDSSSSKQAREKTKNEVKNSEDNGRESSKNREDEEEN